jgi:ribonuclease Z
VHDQDGLRIFCFEVDHGDLIKPAFGYRIDCDGRSAVLSGDTRFNENLIARSQDVDLLVHEVAMAPPEAMTIDRIRRVLAHHSSPVDAARVFTRAAPRLAVYNHIVLLGSDGVPTPSIDDLMRETRKHYSGPLVVGADLMMFEIDDEVRVTTASAPATST